MSVDPHVKAAAKAAMDGHYGRLEDAAMEVLEHGLAAVESYHGRSLTVDDFSAVGAALEEMLDTVLYSAQDAYKTDMGFAEDEEPGQPVQQVRAMGRFGLE